MKLVKILAVMAASTAIATASFAGGLSEQIMEAPVVANDEIAPVAGSSVDPALIVLGILGLLLLGASSSSGSGSGSSSGSGSGSSSGSGSGSSSS